MLREQYYYGNVSSKWVDLAYDIFIESYIRRIKPSNLRSKVLITGNLKYNYFLAVGKD